MYDQHKTLSSTQALHNTDDSENNDEDEESYDIILTKILSESSFDSQSKNAVCAF